MEREPLWGLGTGAKKRLRRLRSVGDPGHATWSAVETGDAVPDSDKSGTRSPLQCQRSVTGHQWLLSVVVVAVCAREREERALNLAHHRGCPPGGTLAFASAPLAAVL